MVSKKHIHEEMGLVGLSLDHELDMGIDRVEVVMDGGQTPLEWQCMYHL